MSDIKKYQKMSLEKLIEASEEISEKLVSLGLKHSQGKLRDTANIKKTKKKLARINTIINQKANDLTKNNA